MEFLLPDKGDCRCHALDNVGDVSPQQTCVLCGIDDVTVEITFVSRHSRCLQCHSPSACAIMYHSSCLEILKNWSTTPDVTIADVENVGICTRILFEPPIRSRPTESISRGLLSPSTKDFLDPRVSQSLVMSLPMEIFHQLLDYIPPMPELIVLGQTDELIKRLRHIGGSQDIIFQAHLSDEIYAKRINFEGVLYISKISNRPFEDADTILKHRSSPKQIVVSKDHLGVRNIQFFDSGPAGQTAGGSPWYEVLNLPESGSNLTIQTYSDVSSLPSAMSKLTESGPIFAQGFPGGGQHVLHLRRVGHTLTASEERSVSFLSSAIFAPTALSLLSD
jgi:hypothetical protein